ncbi:MAG: molybdopterin-dependent oxidoreductase [Kineosporiaceae bacterium]
MTRGDVLRRDLLSRGILHPADRPFPPGAHDTRSAATLGRLLGVTVTVAFATGLISHLHQHPVGWFDLPSRPVRGYQISQGLHVVAGIAALPLLLAKLWVVYRRLFLWPPVRGIGHAAERLMLVPLVAGLLFEVTSGLLNVARWYPWPFFFPRVHYAVAWMVVGALVVHVTLKVHHLRAPEPAADASSEADADRRAVLLGAVGSVAALTLATAGQTVPLLRAVSVLAPRDPTSGPAGVAVNRTAVAAGIRGAARDPGWSLAVAGLRPVRFTLAELAAMPQTTARLPIACVEGWSVSADWTGVPLRALLDLAGAPADAHLRAVSLERDWLYASSPIGPAVARDPLTLLALRLNGEPLDLDHGYPLRLIAPNRPGVHQTKWLARIEPA